MLIGCGLVGKTLLEMFSVVPLGRKILGQYSRLVVVEPTDISLEPTLKELGFNHIVVKKEITRWNYRKILGKYLQTGDSIIDVSYNVESMCLIRYCVDVGINYINTSMERWPINDAKLDVRPDALVERSLITLHEQARELRDTIQIPTSTIILTHGMNPGLITYFTLTGIKHVTRDVLGFADQFEIKTDELSTLALAYSNDDYATMSYMLGVETIHCSERDTQTAKDDLFLTDNNVFANTWSCYSLYSEGVDPIQLGWGTHESESPTYNGQMILPDRGVSKWAMSYVPGADGIINGMLIPHSENETIGRKLTLYNTDGTVKYKPSNYYVYSPCKYAISAMERLPQNKYMMYKNTRYLRGMDLSHGEDAVGALIIMKSDPFQKLLFGNSKDAPVSYWSGTILSIEQTRGLGLNMLVLLRYKLE
jgi:homospermidine synthase